MERSENWSVECSRIVQFFRTQPDMQETDYGFLSGTCEVHLTALPDHREGSLHFPGTNVTLRGRQQDVEGIYHRFFMRFVSAGG